MRESYRYMFNALEGRFPEKFTVLSSDWEAENISQKPEGSPICSAAEESCAKTPPERHQVDLKVTLLFMYYTVLKSSLVEHKRAARVPSVICNLSTNQTQVFLAPDQFLDQTAE